MSGQLTASLSSLLPTVSPLPRPLVELATSLVAQSRTRASTLKPEEEIARTYACCHIACERLGKKLSLEIAKPAPPCPPRVYAKLKTFLGSSLRTPVTPRSRRVEDKVEAKELGSGVKGPGSVGKQAVGAVSAGRSLRSTPAKRATDAVENTPSKRVKVIPKVVEPQPAEEIGASFPQTEEDVNMHDNELTNEGGNEPTPVKRPAKTPLRRKEKHAKRKGKLDEDDDDDLGPAGLLPGLGTMFQPAVDWLSDERRADYKAWEKEIYREMAKVQTARVVG